MNVGLVGVFSRVFAIRCEFGGCKQSSQRVANLERWLCELTKGLVEE